MGNNIKKLRREEVSKHYDLKEKLGTGSFAVVKRAIRKSDGKPFAIKVINKSKLNADELAVVHEEVDIMHRIDNENIVKLIEMFETNKKIYLVMELLTGGELFDRIVAKGSYSEKEAAHLIRCVTQAVQYLHSINIVHRDLKPENLIYLSGDADSPIKITDFGLAKYRKNLKNELMNTACGTPGYVAPEVLKNEPYGAAVDMWSIGVILYILLCGFPPFYHESTAELYRQIKKGQYEFPAPYWSEISDDAKDLVRKLLCVDPTKRYTPVQVLSHQWITGGAANAKVFSAEHNAALQKRLALMQARRRLRKCVQTIIAVNKFSDVLTHMTNDPTWQPKTSTSVSAPPAAAKDNEDDD